MRLLAAICLQLDQFTRRIGHCVAWANGLMVIGTVLVVVLRYGFEIGSIALQETVLYAHALAFMMGMAFTLQRDEHVRVDILYQKLGFRGRCWVNGLGTLLLLLPVMIFIFWESIDYVALSWRVGEGSSETGGLPGVYLLKTLIPLMAVLLVLQGVSELLRQVHGLVTGTYPPRPEESRTHEGGIPLG